jgi:hypothetical protein
VPERSAIGLPTTVPGVLHPVGKLPAAVYWRRRLMVLGVLLAALGGLGWGGFLLVTRGNADEASAGERVAAIRTPQLERVVPSMARVATPTPPELPAKAEAGAGATAVAAAPAGPVAGDPCSDDMIALEVRTPPTVASGSKPTFELLVSNVSAVPCVRALDKGLQEMVLVGPSGNRLWGSNDCFPEVSSDTRTLAPGETVTFPILWGGLSSEPTCTAARSPLPPGSYLLRGRLDTKVSPDAPLTIG